MIPPAPTSTASAPAPTHQDRRSRGGRGPAGVFEADLTSAFASNGPGAAAGEDVAGGAAAAGSAAAWANRPPHAGHSTAGALASSGVGTRSPQCGQVKQSEVIG